MVGYITEPCCTTAVINNSLHFTLCQINTNYLQVPPHPDLFGPCPTPTCKYCKAVRSTDNHANLHWKCLSGGVIMNHLAIESHTKPQPQTPADFMFWLEKKSSSSHKYSQNVWVKDLFCPTFMTDLRHSCDSERCFDVVHQTISKSEKLLTDSA